MLELLRLNRNFRLLWLGQLVSLIGDGISQWSMVYWIYQSSHGSPVVQSLSFVVVTAPRLFLAPFAGVLVDRWDRRQTMIVSDIVRGLLVLPLIYAVLRGDVVLALVASFLSACVSTFGNPARGALLPRLVEQQHLVAANSLNQTTTSLMLLAGPTVGTLVLELLGPSGAFALDGLTFFVSALLVALVRVSAASATARPASRFTAELKEGIRYAWQNPVVRVLIIAFVVLFAGAGIINSMSVLMVRTVLGLPQSALAYSSTASPLAMITASTLIGASARKLKRAHLLVPTGLGLGAAGIGLTAAATALWVVVAGSVLVGLCNAVLNIGLSTTLQRTVPDQVRGRVLSTLNALPTAAMLASSALAGVVAEQISIRWVVGTGAILLGLAGLVSYIGFRGIDLDAVD